jgi:hypothetical protein
VGGTNVGHWAKQSTAVSYVVGPILDSTGAEYAGAVIGDLSISKNGGTLTALASAATLTYVANGDYTLALTTGNMDTLGTVRIFCNKSTYQMPPLALMVLPATVYDALTTNATTAAGGLGDIQRMAGTALTGRDIGASVLLSSGTGTGQVTLTSGRVNADITHIAAAAVSTSTAQLGVNVVNFGGSAGTFASGRPAVNASYIGGVPVTATTSITFPSTCTVATTTGAVGSVTGAVGSVTGLTAANLDVAVSSRMGAYTQPTGFLAATFPGTVASTTNITAGTLTTVTTATNVTMVNGLAAGVITATSIAADAITDAKVASDVTIASVTGAVGSVTGNVGGNVTGSVGSVVGAVGSVTGNVGGNVTGSVGSVATGGIAAASFAAGAIDAAAIAADFGTEIANAVLAAGDIDSYSLEEALKIIGASVAGKLSGAATTTITIRSMDDTANRVTATVDSDGNRTAVTLNEVG